jgi:hypothetical protein
MLLQKWYFLPVFLWYSSFCEGLRCFSVKFDRKLRQVSILHDNKVDGVPLKQEEKVQIPETTSYVNRFQYDPKKIRNFSIIAHIGTNLFHNWSTLSSFIDVYI